jgi:hypothetical protein
MKQLQYKEVTYQIHLAGLLTNDKLLHPIYTVCNNNLKFSACINTTELLILESLCNNIAYIIDA